MLPVRFAFLASLLVFGLAASPGAGAASLEDGEIFYSEDIEDFYGDEDPDFFDEDRCTGDVDPICRIKVVEKCESWQFCAPFLCCSRWRRTTTKWYFPRVVD